jgi:hypothetical protein
MMITGTSYFTSMAAAVRYYAYEGATAATIERKISEGLIHIGKPQTKPGEWLSVIDDGARYAIHDEPMSRAEYMADSARRHQAYYLQLALEIGLTPAILPRSVEQIRESLKTDQHLNNIPLILWDSRVSALRSATAALKARGDCLSLGTGVCILKAYARHVAGQTES